MPIDAQLQAAGWPVYDSGSADLFSTRGVAVREVIMAPGHGRVYYLLRVDKQVVGLIEAKPEGTPLSGVQWQSAMYATGLPESLRKRAVEVDGRLPFVFEATRVDQPVAHRAAAGTRASGGGTGAHECAHRRSRLRTRPSVDGSRGCRSSWRPSDGAFSATFVGRDMRAVLWTAHAEMRVLSHAASESVPLGSAVMRSTTPGGQPFLAAIQSTYVDLDRWQARARTAEEPQPGSELAQDDRIFPRHRISEVARMSLVLAGEHLRLARDAIEVGQLYPSAHFTLLRGGLVGAAQAVWVLSPVERSQRQERGLTVLSEMHTQMRKYYVRVASFDLGEVQRRELGEQQSWLSVRIAQVEAARTGRSALNFTDEVIPQALDLSFPDVARRQDGRALWALMSGDAHVLGWSTVSRGQMGRPDRASGLAEGTVGGSFADIAQPFMATHGLLRTGWSLFDRRCERP